MNESSGARLLIRMLKLTRPLRGRMVLAVSAGTLGFLAAQFLPILAGFALLSGLGYPLFLSRRALFTVLIALALSRAFFRLTEQRMNHDIAFRLLALIRDRVFKALRRLCPAKLDGRDKGDLISLITADVELLEVFYAHTISPICIALLCSVTMAGFIGRYHWSLGILALIAYAAVGILLPAFIARRSGWLGAELRSQSGELAADMLENIRGLDETLQFGCSGKRLLDMQEKTEALSLRQGDLNRLSGLDLALTNSLILGFSAAMLLLSAWLCQHGRVGFEGFLIPLTALLSSFGPVTAIANLGTGLAPTLAAASRIFAILDEKPETEAVEGELPLEFSGAELRHACFAYGGEEVLKDFSATFPKGRIVGLLGPSGCGKSTVLKLLMRFWQLKQGSAELSGRSVDAINTADLRSMESYMTQETQLFQDTIANNVRIAKLDASDDEVERACRKAALHDVILSLPKGYQTAVGELGETLSGGERQRIGLARAFLHRAPFLLLDEPSSNLDSLNEAVILRSLKEEAKGSTIALVSHRASTLRIADCTIDMGKRKEPQA